MASVVLSFGGWGNQKRMVVTGAATNSRGDNEAERTSEKPCSLFYFLKSYGGKCFEV